MATITMIYIYWLWKRYWICKEKDCCLLKLRNMLNPYGVQFLMKHQSIQAQANLCYHHYRRMCRRCFTCFERCTKLNDSLKNNADKVVEAFQHNSNYFAEVLNCVVKIPMSIAALILCSQNEWLMIHSLWMLWFVLCSQLLCFLFEHVQAHNNFNITMHLV